MPRSIKKFVSNIPPHVGIVGALIAVVAIASAALLLSRSEPTVDANFVPRAARIERVDGSVGVASALTEPSASELEWEEAVRNAPLTAGDRVYAREGSRAVVALTGRNYAKLDSGSAIDVLSLADRRTQLALRDGSAIFDVGELEDGELFEVATPNGAVDFYEPGLYQVGIGDSGDTWISVLSGLAQVVGLAGSGEISKGEILTLVGQTAAQAVLSRMAPDFAGGLVDDYYGYRYPATYDGRYRDYNAYLDDPYYYDPYRRSVSYQYVDDYIPGVNDLDYYGDWREVDGYGHCWSPRVDAGWAPYRNGYWDVDNVYGPTWISQEPWGWAPYHYGRWANVNGGQWVWVPDSIRTRSVYAPALVAFVPLTRTNHIGWVPLAPGEPYVSRYYDASYQPQYFASPEYVAEVVSVQRTFINSRFPQAVTVVPVQDFTRVINQDVIASVNPQWIAQTQPVLDPYAIAGFRQIAESKREVKRRMKMERALANQVFSTPVVASASPVVLPGREGVIDQFQVATVPEKQRKQKIKINDQGQVVTARGKGGDLQPVVTQSNTSERIEALRAQAAQGDKGARREMKQLRREQRLQQAGQGAVSGPQQAQVQQGVVPSDRKAQKQAARQQRIIQQNQQVVNQQGRLNAEQRRAQKQAARQQRMVQQNQQPSFNQQAAVNAEQRRAQKQAARQQRQAAAAGQQQQVRQAQIDQQTRQQRKMQKRAERQQSVIQQRQQPSFNQAAYDAAREQRRAQKQAARQQRMNQQSASQQQWAVQQQQQRQAKERVFVNQAEKQQRKAERRAAQQQVRPQAPEQVRVQPRAQYQGPATQQGSVDAAQAQRRAAKAERKAARKNQ
ncbi:MAG TPA: DUF6600 domain-containing protein [Blastocatellia bacterium]|nr:DUF6600 domain-containing protein [Blastocatellia bacterium]